MKLLIHSCCADCLLKMKESIKKEKRISEIKVYYYNPNIHPRSEYQSRLKAMQQITKKDELIVADWRPKEYFEAIKSRVKGKRCLDCWRLRLEKTAQFASKNGYQAFSSTLLSSNYQNDKRIAEIGKEVGKKYQIEFIIPKNLCKELDTKGFYKQVFWGCVYSLKERFEEKFKKE